MRNNYEQKEQLSNGVWVFPDGYRPWGGEVNHNFELLNNLLNRNTLTVKQNGDVIGIYDGKDDATIDLAVRDVTNNDIDALFKDDPVIATINDFTMQDIDDVLDEVFK